MQESEHQVEHHSWRLLNSIGLVIGFIILLTIVLILMSRSYTGGNGPFSGFFSQKSGSTPPVLAWGTKDIDFGSVKTKEEKTVSIKNSGKTSLSITQITPSCECVTVAGGKSSFAAGEKVELTITLDPAKAPRKGKQSFVISTESNAKNRETADLIVLADIK